MLGTSLDVLQAATSDTSNQFDRDGGPPAGTGDDGVWFDCMAHVIALLEFPALLIAAVFGRVFCLLRLHTLFALSITLIVVPFVVMALTTYFLYSNNKLYYLNNTPLCPQPPEHSNLPKTTRGWRGLFRFPVAFVVASAAVVGVVFLVNKVNPMIAYTSQYAVWAMFMSVWWSVAWFVLRGADADNIRPTALGRGYAFIEQWLLWWAVLIAVAVSIDRAHLASGYFVVVSYAGVFLSAWISLLELVGLPRKPVAPPISAPAPYGSEGPSDAAAPSDGGHEDATEETPLFRGAGRPTTFGSHSRREDDAAIPPDGEHEGASEETPLFRGAGRPMTFGGYSRPEDGSADESDAEGEYTPPEGVYGKEQAWSKDLPTWVWVIQFLLSVPLPLIFTASIGLLLSTAVNQTGADGSSTLAVYLLMGILSILILLPGSPFYHRISYYVTTFIFAVFIGTLVYNLTAFPFSEKYRLKVYFQQSVELETGINTAYLVGHPDFVKDIVTGYIPSAQGGAVTSAPDPLRVGLTRVSWAGLAPAVVPEIAMRDWVQYNTTSLGVGKARIFVNGRNTRACKLLFSNPVLEVGIWGEHKQLGKPVPPQGTVELRLWSRRWEAGWTVDVGWDAGTVDDGRLRGKIVCLWSDANNASVEIQALWEASRYMPTWAVVSKLSDGLVEGWRPFVV